MLSIIGIIVYGLIICGIGLSIVNKINIDDTNGIPTLFSAFILGSIATGVVIFILGEFCLLSTPIVIIYLFVGFLLCFIYKAKLLTSISETFIFLNSCIPRIKGKRLYFYLVILILILWLISLAWLPPRTADAMRYHLAQIKDIFENSGIVFKPYFHYNFPLYFPVISFPMYVFFGGVGVQFIVLGYFLLSIICLLRIAVLLNIKKSGFLLIFLMFLTPIIFHEAHIAKDDLVVIFYILAGFTMLLEKPKAEKSFHYIVISFLSLGFAIGIKYQAVLLIPWFIVIALSRFSEDGLYKKGVRLFFCLCCMLLVSSPFFIRNYINTGDPVWPLLQNLFAVKKDYLYLITERYARALAGKHSLVFLWYTIKREIRTFYQSPIFIIILGFIGVLFARRSRLKLGVGFLTYFVLWWIVQPSLCWRFSIYCLPLIFISIANMYERLGNNFFKKVLSILLGIYLICCITVAFIYSKGLLSYYFRPDLKNYHRATWFYKEYKWINRNLPKDSKLLVIVYSGHTYYLDRSYLRADPFLSGLIDWRKIKNYKEFKAKLKELGINYILYQKIHWNGFSGGKQMMKLIKSIPQKNIIWTHKVKLYYSRIREQYYDSELVLFKVDSF